MSRLEELKQASESLSPEEFSRLSQRFWEKEQCWDKQINRDSAAGKGDFVWSILPRSAHRSRPSLRNRI